MGRGGGDGAGFNETRKEKKVTKSGRKAAVVATAAAAAVAGGGVEGGAGNDENTWAHARAALVLRTEAVATALLWVAGAETIQVENVKYATC